MKSKTSKKTETKNNGFELPKDEDSIEYKIIKHAIVNAVQHKGSAVPNAVLGKMLADNPELKTNIPATMKKINELVTKVNSLKPNEQTELYEKNFKAEQEKKEEIKEKKHDERNIFAVLNIKDGDKIKTAFPPGPEKYPHIGHAKACLLNYILAQKYNGKFVLRFEDTNPNLVQAIFYDMLIKDLSWLGVKWDELQYASDHMDLFYKFAEKVIKDDKAYMCFCNEEKIKESRATGLPCACRAHSIKDNLKYWKEFPKYKEGEAILRLKIDLMHQNTTMRDPTIFRIIDTPHARHGTKYRVWPNYDFQNAIMDGYFEITHRLRSKEFEMRSELQRYIQTILGLYHTTTYEFARASIEGVELSGRKIRDALATGGYIGWDDPRLGTIAAMRRRGFLPEAIKNFVVATGITKAESTITWDNLIVQNKKILDKTARRYFFLHDYEKIKIEKAPKQTVKLKLHPEHEEYGFRELDCGEEFYVQKSDLSELKENELYRLMDCLNFRKTKGKYVFDSLEHEHYKDKGKKIMHFLPVSKDLIDAEILMNDISVVKGIAEQSIKDVKVNDVIQFERFGFCRLDSVEEKGKKKIYKFWFTHR